MPILPESQKKRRESKLTAALFKNQAIENRDVYSIGKAKSPVMSR
ncbi:hypothetical protein DSM3645_25407 [Blastopirellula marina DSM 3645]|uniref:Uncharacterized protein n=1 Tax=Blastopirellula marina DSM 3645 TaxID=314230 RepID=A4A0E9_9BACT|nr:hypothetical protein DSM3645_25407 [Blastopirellula marina DSM 3645]